MTLNSASTIKIHVIINIKSVNSGEKGEIKFKICIYIYIYIYNEQAKVGYSIKSLFLPTVFCLLVNLFQIFGSSYLKEFYRSL